jgi:hypothetical protein
MGQKANTLTLTLLKKDLNLISENSKTFLYGFKFLVLFEKLLNKKGVILINKNLNLENNKCNLSLGLFFGTFRMLKYSRRNFFIKKKSGLFAIKKSKKELKLFSKFFKTNFLNLKIENYNHFLTKGLIVFFFNKLKIFSSSLFPRRQNFFLDFIKLSCLFITSKINSSVYLSVIGLTFKVLQKKKHTQFLFFLKFLFKTIISKKNSSILGVKLLINGKLKGKARASSTYIQQGSVPTQSISKNIEFSKIHVYTRFGAFGFQFWVHKKN